MLSIHQAFFVLALVAAFGSVDAATRIRIEPAGDPVNYISWVKVENTYHAWVRIPRNIYGAQQSDGLYYGVAYSVDNGDWGEVRGSFEASCTPGRTSGCQEYRETWSATVYLRLNKKPNTIEFAIFAGANGVQAIWDNNGGFRKNYRLNFRPEPDYLPKVPLDQIAGSGTWKNGQVDAIVSFVVTPIEPGHRAQVFYSVNGGRKQKVDAQWQSNRQLGPVGRPFPFGSEVWEVKFSIKDVRQKTDKIEFQIHLDRSNKPDSISQPVQLSVQ